MKFLTSLSIIGVVLFASNALAQDQPAPAPTPQERVAMLKQWLQASQAQLRTYEWIETTAISKGGEEKSRDQKSCYYGVDGVLQKVPVSHSAAESGGPPGILLPGKLLKKGAERKKEEIVEYMKSAGELVQSYVPPDPARIQQSVNAGKFSVNPVQPGRRVRLEFRDYLKAGDMLAVEIELPTNRLLGMRVSSYLEDAEDAVELDVAMGVLPDGTIYTAHTALDAKAKGMRVVVENSGHRRMAGG
jgi:hypothetical protein